MMLREFFYFNKNSLDLEDNARYIPGNDSSILKNRDLRKIRLTLKDLNEIRKASEAHKKEEAEEGALIRKMYAMPPPEAAAG
jgi:hypothetical protein